MFAVIADGGRQYRVQPGDVVSVDFRAEIKTGDVISFDQVLLANGGGSSSIGKPTIAGATVQGEVVLDEEKGVKLDIFKMRRRKNYRRKTGHRQKYTRVKITGINVPGLQIVEKNADAQAT